MLSHGSQSVSRRGMQTPRICSEGRPQLTGFSYCVRLSTVFRGRDLYIPRYAPPSAYLQGSATCAAAPLASPNRIASKALDQYSRVQQDLYDIYITTTSGPSSLTYYTWLLSHSSMSLPVQEGLHSASTNVTNYDFTNCRWESPICPALFFHILVFHSSLFGCSFLLIRE